MAPPWDSSFGGSEGGSDGDGGGVKSAYQSEMFHVGIILLFWGLGLGLLGLLELGLEGEVRVRVRGGQVGGGWSAGGGGGVSCRFFGGCGKRCGCECCGKWGNGCGCENESGLAVVRTGRIRRRRRRRDVGIRERKVRGEEGRGVDVRSCIIVRR